MLPQSEVVDSVWHSRTAPPHGPDVVVVRTLQRAFSGELPVDH